MGEVGPALARTKSFRDDRGNRFIIPSMVIYPGADEPSGSDVILRAMSLRIALQVDLDQDWLEFDPAAFPHVETFAGHSSFLHGGATVWLFAGPVFDDVATNPKDRS